MHTGTAAQARTGRNAVQYRPFGRPKRAIRQRKKALAQPSVGEGVAQDMAGSKPFLQPPSSAGNGAGYVRTRFRPASMRRKMKSKKVNPHSDDPP